MANAPPVTHAVRGHAVYVRRFALEVVAGPDVGARVTSASDELTIGTAAGADLRLTDAAVSRLHCAIRVTPRGLELRDLGSTNGTILGEHEVAQAFLRGDARIRLGHTAVAIAILDDEIEQPLADAARFGELIGASPAMRRLYPLIEQVAHRDAPVLVTGETGTGKELVAEAIHLASARRAAPFVVVDCSTLPRQLAEAALFGDARAPAPGDGGERLGAFADAHGGTLLLDEVGDLPLDLQPLLRRVLEDGLVHPIGGDRARAVDVRVIAASHRDLRVEVNARRFRADLFYRLDVLRVAVPPLRERDGDVALLAAHFWQQARAGEAIPETLCAALAAQSWPGNVRELRNTVERTALVGWTPPRHVEPSYGQAKDAALRQWERGWVEQLLARHDHNLSRAARAAQMGRSNLRQLCQRHGLRLRGEAGEV
jgi:transcriptional regulator with GAF, ATPase, and Fis domain